MWIRVISAGKRVDPQIGPPAVAVGRAMAEARHDSCKFFGPEVRAACLGVFSWHQGRPAVSMANGKMVTTISKKYQHLGERAGACTVCHS